MCSHGYSGMFGCMTATVPERFVYTLDVPERALSLAGYQPIDEVDLLTKSTVTSTVYSVTEVSVISRPL